MSMCFGIQEEPIGPPKPTLAGAHTEAIDMVVSVIDVGQGDAVLIQSEGRVMLVDAGDTYAGDEVVAYLKESGISKIDLLVATHPDADHIGGIPKVLDAFDAGSVIAPQLVRATGAYERFMEAVRNEPDAKLATPKVGDTYGIGDAVVEVIANGTDAKNSNDASLVLRLTCGGASALLTGDISQSVERRLVEQGAPLDSDVLKVAHHGSRSSSDEGFLEAVGPDFAVISCGAENSYGHPHPEAVERLSKTGARIYQTDRDGTVTFLFSDGTITAKAA
jgi:beta-lactamase superfamily II metal-dependent hydrolase